MGEGVGEGIAVLRLLKSMMKHQTASVKAVAWEIQGEELGMCSHGHACEAGAWGHYIGFCL